MCVSLCVVWCHQYGGFWHDTTTSPTATCDNGNQCVYYNDLWVWVPVSPPAANDGTAWQKITPDPSSPVPRGRTGHAAAFIESNRLLIFGGIGPDSILNDLWQFEESTRTWTALLPGTRG